MENTIYCKTELIEEINALIQRWSDERPQTRTLAHLSRETGVSDSALRRLRNQKAKISDDMLYRILDTIFERSEFAELKNKVSGSPAISKWLMRHYSFLETIPALAEFKFTEASDEIVVNPIAFSVFALVSSIEGITQEYLKEQFGIRGLQEANALVEKSIIKFDGKAYVMTSESNKVKISKSAVVSLMPELTKLYLKEDSTISAEILTVCGLSTEGYYKLTSAVNDFISVSRKIMNEHQGNTPVILSGFVNTMTVQTVNLEN